MLIDTHAHLEDKKFSRDLDRVIARASDAGIERLVCIADDLPTSRQAVALAKRCASIVASVGVHPHHERRFKEGDVEELKKLCRSRNVVAIGEVGLDFHYPGFSMERQIEMLALQGRLATERGLPLVLHCRDAYPELIDFFRREEAIEARGVVHCFSGSYEEATALLDMGFYLGFGGTLTYPNGGHLRETVGRIGLDRIVTETDSPYLPPQKKRGRRNEPSYMKFAVKELADATGFTYQDVARITSANAVDLYGLKNDPTPTFAYSVRRRVYLNVTNRCTNDCCFCGRSSDYSLHGHHLELPAEPTAAEVLGAIDDPDRYEEFVICGLGEPTMRLDVVLEIATALKAEGRRVRLNTNGHGTMIHGENIAPKLAGLIDSVTIAMNAHDRESYNEISHPADTENSFDAMIDFTREVKKSVPDVRTRVVAMPQVDVEACRRLAEDVLKVRFQVRAHRPNGYPLPLTQSTSP